MHHELFKNINDSNYLANDIGLVRVKKDITFSTYVKSIKLVDRDFTNFGDVVMLYHTVYVITNFCDYNISSSRSIFVMGSISRINSFSNSCVEILAFGVSKFKSGSSLSKAIT